MKSGENSAIKSGWKWWLCR